MSLIQDLKKAPEFDPSVCPKNYFVESLMATILCCLPLGVMAILSSAKVESLYREGRAEEAYAKSMETLKYIKWSVLGYFAFVVVYILFAALFA